MKLRKGMVVAVTFNDHAMNTETPPEFVAYGMISTVTPDTLIIDAWHYADKETPRDDNVESFTIMRSAIKRIVRLTDAR